MSTGVYGHAAWCDVAFSFRDLVREADGIEACIRAHSRIPVKRIIDIGCGTAPHLPELSRRGYAYTGLDSAPAMLGYARGRAAVLGAAASFIEGDLARFTVPEPFDFAFMGLNSLYVRDLAGVAGHLASVAAALRPGGLYFLDWCIQNVPLAAGRREWEAERDGVRVRASVAWTNVDEPARLFDETVVFAVDDHGRRETAGGTIRRRAVYPDEFLRLVGESGLFDPVGWWDDWNMERMQDGPGTSSRPQVAVRRRHGPGGSGGPPPGP